MGPVLHGVGILNYELPKIDHPYGRRGYPEILKRQMVLAFTNLGLYFDNFGLKYEDTFLVNSKEPKIFTEID